MTKFSRAYWHRICRVADYLSKLGPDGADAPSAAPPPPAVDPKTDRRVSRRDEILQGWEDFDAAQRDGRS
jgi:hypothetical protein